jgi:hypothetical protein
LTAPIDEATQARRAALLARLKPLVVDLEVEAPTAIEAQLDLASVLFACALGIAGAAIGPAGLVDHLEGLAEEWRGRIVTGKSVAGGVVH